MPLSPKCGRCNMSFLIRDAKYPQGNRLPLMLECGHTFCSDCLTRLARQHRTSITCSKCNKLTALTEDSSVKSLCPDYYIIGLLTANRSGLPLQPQVQELSKLHYQPSAEKPKQVNCEECGVKATSCRCIKCDVLLCGACFEKIHKASNVLRQHQAEPYTTNTTDIVYGSNRLQLCDVHKCINEYYCTDEEMAFCTKCVSEYLHRDHSVIALEDKEKSDTGELNVALGQVTSVINHSKQSLQLLSSFELACQSHGSRLIEKLQDHFLKLHSVLQARENSLICELHKLFQADIGSLAEMVENLKEKIKKMEVIIKDAKSVVAGTNRNLTSMQLMEHVREIVSSPCHAMVAGFGNMEILLQCEDDKLLQELQSYGHWKGKFVNEIKFNKLSDVPSDAEISESTPLPTSSSENSSGETSASESNCGSDLNGFSLNSDPEFLPPQDHQYLPKNKTKTDARNKPDFLPPQDHQYLSKNKIKTDSKAKPSAGSRFKIRLEMIHVSHINDPCNFYVNLSRDLDALAILSANINSHCNYAGRRDVPNAVDVGDQVLAQFGQDGQWYRAQVIEVDAKSPTGSSACKVMYTDYGNTELLPLDRIRNTHPKFLQLPRMGKRCSLVDIVPVEGPKWSNEAITAFARVTKDRPMLLSLLKETPDLWFVDLSRPASEEIEDDGPASARDVLIFLNLACFISPYSLPVSKSGEGVKRRQYLTPILPHLGDSVRVSLTYVVSPHDFYAQMLGSESRHLQELMVTMKKTYDEDRGDLYTLFCPAKGMLCVAKYGDDDMWYRAEVVDVVRAGQVSIRYVDYGNTEMVSIWKLKKLLDIYMILPAQAVHCRLADIGPVNESGLWPEEATKFLGKMVKEPELILKVKETISRSTLSVYVHSELMIHSVNTSMISNGWAVATGPGWEPPPCTAKSLYKIAQNQKNHANKESYNAKVKDAAGSVEVVHGIRNGTASSDANSDQEKPTGPVVTVCHIESPGEFYVHTEDDAKAAQQLVADVKISFANDLASDSLNDVPDCKEKWILGDLCAANNPSDQQWYRAQISKILESAEPSVEVSCVDFGYKFVVAIDSLRSIPEQFRSVRHYATCCHFVDIIPAGDPSRWSQTSCDAFKSLVTGKTCFLVAKDAKVSESLPVDLVFEMRTKGGAVTPDVVSYHSVASTLRDKGLALKKRVISVRSSDDRLKDSPARDLSVSASLTAVNACDTSVGTQNVPASVDIKESSSAQKLDDDEDDDVHDDSMGDYLPPELPSSDSLVLGVTHVDQDCVIYGQEIKKDLRPLQEFTDHVQSHYKSSLPNIGYEWKVGQKVVAQYTMDDGYYRGKILSLADNLAEVYYADYGNRERLSTERLRLPLFTNKPVQCYKCVMPGLKWISLENASKFLYGLLVGKVCNVHIQRTPELGLPLIVNVVSPETNDLAQYLCDHDYAAREEIPVKEQEQAQESVPFIKEELQSDEIVKEILTDNTEVAPSSSTSALPPVQGEPSEKLSGKTSTVSSDASLESLQNLTASVLASASDLCPPAFPHPDGYGSWVGEAENLAVMTDPISVSKRKKSSPYIQPLEPKPDEEKMMTVTQVDAPNIVYLQNVKLENTDSGDCLEINRQLDCLLSMNMWYGANVNECPLMTKEQLKPGVPCIAKFSLDDCWYRAEIIDVQSGEESLNVFVLFVDYGSNESVTEIERIRALPAEHLLLPAQAVICNLHGLVPKDGWGQEDVDLVDQSVKERVLVAVFKNVANGHLSADLYDQEVYMHEGVASPLVYQPLIDKGILISSNENILNSSEQTETSSESGSFDGVAIKCSSKASSKLDEAEDTGAMILA